MRGEVSKFTSAELRTYNVAITGETPLLMHWDNIEWADAMEAWNKDPNNKKFSKAGDDRTPPWRWVGCMYHDGENVAIPQDNMMRALMEGGAMVLVPGGKNGKTFKSQTQSGLLMIDPFWRLLVKGKPVPVSQFLAKVDDTKSTFGQHIGTAREHGFELFVKRVKVGQSKHIRVRPMFTNWSATGSIQVIDEQITTQALTDILRMAGTYKGLCEWRPGGRTPGPFGRFNTTVTEA